MFVYYGKVKYDVNIIFVFKAVYDKGIKEELGFER